MIQEVISSESIEEIVFGSECKWCEQEDPCDCHDDDWSAPCKCSCDRCMFDVP